jgi:hypothetical protein
LLRKARTRSIWASPDGLWAPCSQAATDPRPKFSKRSQEPAHDGLLDLSNRSEIIVDPFLGSGSTLIAADKTGRVCRGVELEPLHVDVIIRRYQAATGNATVLVETGETFEALAVRRSREAPV